MPPVSLTAQQHFGKTPPSLLCVYEMSAVRVSIAGDPHAKLRGPEAVLQGVGQGLQVHAGAKTDL